VRTAPHWEEAKEFFTVIHPFHPWRGRRFELIDVRRRWGQWRVYYLTEEGDTAYLPACWTDVGPKDPFVEQAQGRAIARIDDLLELTKIIGGLVKEIRPKM
jgi:hypothetical protein